MAIRRLSDLDYVSGGFRNYTPPKKLNTNPNTAATHVQVIKVVPNLKGGLYKAPEGFESRANGDTFLPYETGNVRTVYNGLGVKG